MQQADCADSKGAPPPSGGKSSVFTDQALQLFEIEDGPHVPRALRALARGDREAAGDALWSRLSGLQRVVMMAAEQQLEPGEAHDMLVFVNDVLDDTMALHGNFVRRVA